MMLWMYGRNIDRAIEDLEQKFAQEARPSPRRTSRSLKAGFNYGETAEVFDPQVRGQAGQAQARQATATSPATRPPRWASSPRRSIRATALPGQLPDHARLRHPARAVDVQELRRHHLPGRGRDRRHLLAIGAAFGGALALTTSSGPGIALKTEAMGLALMLELPLVICNIQRGGPSTGLPTKTEQADLLQAIYGRNSESPDPGDRLAHAGRLLRDRLRGLPDRGEVHDAGDLPLRRLPRQRLGAVADPRRREAARRSR